MYVEEGKSLREISEATGIPKSTLYGLLKAYGVEFRSKGQPKRIPWRRAWNANRLYMHGATTCEIAELEGVAVDTVVNWLRATNTKMRDRSQSARLRFARRPRRKPQRQREEAA
jgi:transposase